MNNNGKPIALCNRCFCMMCYVKCEDDDTDKACIIIEHRNHGEGDFTSKPIGTTPPIYCDKCDKLLNEYSLN